ncbi:MAG TPA: ABC transporter ATP-binding protein [Thermoanaerobaculia bacterium]|nr:ABC transporter ATP-binding protein [Thermoanaerobaculia bacterium]
MSPPVVRAEGLTKVYGSGAAAVRVFENLSIEVLPGEFVAVVGPSGCGKSTLLHLLAGIDSPDSGFVEIDGVRMSSLDAAARAKLRNERIGFVFQFHHLLPEFSAAENVALPLRIAAVPAREARRRAGEILDRVGLAGRADHFPAEMSGGELQRAAVGRAIARSPRVILADEPTGNLDRANADRVFQLLRDVQRESGGSVVLVTHDPDLASRCDKIFSMSTQGNGQGTAAPDGGNGSPDV